MTGSFLTLIFVAGALAVIALYLLWRDLRSEDVTRLKRRISAEPDRVAERPTPDLFRGLEDEAAWMLDELKPKTWRQQLQIALDQAGLSTDPQSVLVKACVYGGLMACGIWLLSMRWWTVPIAFVVGFALPFLVVALKRRRRLAKLAAQLPDVFAMMSRVLRAGQTTNTAMETVAEEFDDPVSGEFAFCSEEQRLGMAHDVALRDLARRTGLLEIRMFVVASTVQRETGGNLAELLDNLSTVIRRRFRVRQEIKSLTAEGRLQAAILLLLPFVLFVLLMLLNPTHFSVLLDYPGLIVLGLVWETIGAIWIRKIVNFDY